MRKLVVFGLLFSVFVACNQKNDDIPSNILSKDSMMNVLMDIHIAEAGVKTMAADSIAINTKSYYDFIFK